MNDIQLARLAEDLREDIRAAADSALLLGDPEVYIVLTKYITGVVVKNA